MAGKSVDEIGRRVENARVARLGTVMPDGRVHLVPCVFALDDDTLYTPVDAKPKRTRRLQRLKNIATDPRVTVLIDNYSENWPECWWVRIRGRAEILNHGKEFERARTLLRARYPQYKDATELGPIIAVRVEDWKKWDAASRG